MSNEKNEEFKMKYSLATNFDPDLIKGIRNIDKDNLIKTVFGKIKNDAVGGGRAAMLLPDLTFDDLEDYIKLCHENNINFNYLLNPFCMANREFIQETHNEIVKHLEKLVDIGVDAVTVNSPFLCELIKKRFPQLKISAGVGTSVNEMQHIIFWENLGADELTLQHNVNRNFPLLETMLKHTKNTGTKLRIIGNNVCLHACPYRPGHGTGQAHASEKVASSQKSIMDYHLLKCTIQKMENPAELIAAEWVRPEDVKYYEELCRRTENYNFSIKLVDRTKTTEFLLRVANAYLSKNYSGNFMDIVMWPTLKEVAQIDKAMKEIAAGSAESNKEITKRYFNFLKTLPNVYIDNKALDGFMENFTQSFKCNSNICQHTISSCRLGNNGDTCSYCNSWAQKAITIDNTEVAQWLDNSRKIISDMCDSEFFQ